MSSKLSASALELFDNWIKANTKEEKDGHLLLNSVLTQHYIQVDRHRFYETYIYYAWKFQEVVPKIYELRRSPLCGEKTCISHFIKCQRDLESINDMQEGDFRYVTEYLQKNSKQHEDGCRLWTGHLDVNGYGTTSLLRRVFISQHAHGVSWQLANLQKIPEGLQVRHLCGKANRKNCIAPAHLAIGTNYDNQMDRFKDGTMLYGETAPNATITKEKALAIKNSKGQGTAKQRAAKFGVSAAIVRFIDAAVSWRSVFTKEELATIDANRRKRKRVTRPQVRAFKKLRRDGLSIEASATKVGLTSTVAYYINSGDSHADVHVDSDDADDDMLDAWKDEHYREEMKKLILANVKIELDGEKTHWRWQRPLNKTGYGRINYYSRLQSAHAVVWMLWNRYEGKCIPRAANRKDQMLVRHGCGYTDCVSPSCSRGLGTAADNAEDMRIDGTLQSGTKNKGAKLTAEQVLDIRSSSRPHKELAKEYKVTRQTIWHAVQGITYKDVVNPGAQDGTTKNVEDRLLTPNEVQAIRFSLKPGEELALEYGVHAETIRAIRENRRYRS